MVKRKNSVLGQSPGVRNNQSLGKALQILEVMACSPAGMRLQEISRQLNVPASTVIRFLNTFMDYEYVAQNPENSEYYLTLKLTAMGERIKSRFQIRRLVRPFLEAISATMNEAASLAIEQDRQVVYIDAVEGPDCILQTLQRIGKNAPLNSTGVGKILLLAYTDEQIDELIKVRGLPTPTSHTISNKQDLIAELETIRERGYAVDDEECEYGVRCVAMPLIDYTGHIMAAISMTAPVLRMPPERIEEIGTFLLQQSELISRQCGKL